MKPAMISIGNFFFHYRNRAFPLILIALYLIAPPPARIFGSDQLEGAKDFIALLIAFSGLALRGLVIGFAYIKRGGLNKKVYAENLVTSGLFGVCRNPLYVGNMLIYLGVFLLHGNPIVMGLGIALFYFIYWCIVFAEEAYLLNKFQDAYLAYCRDVPRFIPKFSLYRSATEGMVFNFRRALIKDYSTIATTLVTLTVTEAYEYLALADRWIYVDYIAFLGGVLLATGLAALTVRILKKRKWLTDAPSA